MQIIVAPIPQVAVTVTDDGKQRQVELLSQSKLVVAVSDPATQDSADQLCRTLKTEVKGVRDAQKLLNAPARNLISTINSTGDTYCAPIDAEIERISKLVSTFQDAELKRVNSENARLRADEERLRNELAERNRLAAQAERDAATANVASPDADTLALVMREQAAQAAADLTVLATRTSTGPSRAPGMIVRKVVKYEITDPIKVWAKWPNFFKLEPRASIINATIFDGFECPGMRVWIETETGFKKV